jgi:hypothetical protein
MRRHAVFVTRLLNEQRLERKGRAPWRARPVSGFCRRANIRMCVWQPGPGAAFSAVAGAAADGTDARRPRSTHSGLASLHSLPPVTCMPRSSRPDLHRRGACQPAACRQRVCHLLAFLHPTSPAAPPVGSSLGSRTPTERARATACGLQPGRKLVPPNSWWWPPGSI